MSGTWSRHLRRAIGDEVKPDGCKCSAKLLGHENYYVMEAQHSETGEVVRAHLCIGGAAALAYKHGMKFPIGARASTR